MSEERTDIKRLYRSRQERMIAGVAGGLGQYFNVDPTLMRLGFVILTLISGTGLLAYIILAIVTPERPVGEPEPIVTGSIGTRVNQDLLAYALVGLGLLLLAGNLGLFRIFRWDYIWPILLIAIGVLLLLGRNRR